MATLGARITESEPGRVVLELETGPQHRHGGGLVQGGIITQIADAAMGMSLGTLQEDGMWNTTVELKINYLRPITGRKVTARSHLLRIGKTLCTARVDVFDDRRKYAAVAIVTYMLLDGAR